MPTGRRLEGFTASELLAATPNAVFVVNANWQFTYVDETAEQLLNRSSDELVGADLWEEFPDAVGSSFESEYRHAMVSGEPTRFVEFYPSLESWFSVQATPKNNHLFVFFYDVTEIKAAEQKAARIASTHALIGKVATSIAESADTDHIHSMICNETADFLHADSCWILEFDPVSDTATVISGNLSDDECRLPVDTPLEIPVNSALGRMRYEGTPVRDISPLDTYFQGIGTRLTGALVPVRLPGRIWGAIAIMWDDPALEEAEAVALMRDLAELLSVALGNVAVLNEMARKAATDPLTGLANLRSLHTELDAAISRIGTKNLNGLTVAVADVDHFKAVNDGLGHEAGDRVLEAVADALRDSAASAQTIARIGGDEFAILFESSMEWSEIDRIRESIASAQIDGAPAPTASIGFARWHEGLTREGIQRRADDALYWSKLHGRNACWEFDPTVMERVDPEERAVELRRAGVALDPDHALTGAHSANEFWQSTVDALDFHIAVINEDGEIIAVNEAWERYAAAFEPHPETVALGANYLDACASGDSIPYPDQVTAGLRGVLNGTKQSFELQYPLRNRDGEQWFVLRANRFPGLRPHRAVVHREDVTETTRAHQHLVNQARLLDRVPAAVMTTDRDGRVTNWFRGAHDLFGYTADEAVGEVAAELLVCGSSETESIRRGLLAGNDWEGELELRSKSGRKFTGHVNLSSTFDVEGTPSGALGVAIDVGERQAQLEASELARDYFMAIAASIDEGLLTCDTKGRVTFANDAAGTILRRSPQSMIGRTLGELVRGAEGDPCPSELASHGTSRMSNDSFLRGDGSWATVTWSATEIAENPYGDGEVIVFGETSPSERSAERARRRTEGAKWAQKIRAAIQEGGFKLYQQPIVDLASSRVVDRELLIRMSDGNGGIITPDRFLPAAEEFELMPMIDSWTLEHAARIASSGTTVHMNLSAQSTAHEGFLEKMGSTITSHALQPGMLTFELTETALIHSTEEVLEFAHRVRELGCCLALDDFGTGYNSLARIKDLPLDELKVDREFTADILTGMGSQSVVKTIIALANELDLQAVAEGVETKEVATRLRELGVRHAQGFYFGRPASSR